jgi:16S rRNA (guanine527-N7)-methyltransferase
MKTSSLKCFPDVSRETIKKLEEYVALVVKWNPKINLISKGDLEDIWDRHIEDSAQIVSLPKIGPSWVDLGSGGGFPGIVVAILLRSISPSTKVVLVESDGRKATFLRQVALKLDLNCDVLNKRIEVISIEENTILSARALARLPKLLDIIEPLTHKDTVCLFMKGKNFSKELKLAQDTWSFDCDVVESRTNAEAAVLVIRNICRAKK